MPKFRVYPYVTISTVVEVEAEDENAAIEDVMSRGLPGVMFLDHTYPDVGDWECDEAEPADE